VLNYDQNNTVANEKIMSLSKRINISG